MKKLVISFALALFIGAFAAPVAVTASSANYESVMNDDEPTQKDATQAKENTKDNSGSATTENATAEKKNDSTCTKTAEKSSCSKAKDGDKK